jgi:hypothetical protein
VTFEIQFINKKSIKNKLDGLTRSDGRKMPITHAKFQLGGDTETKVFRTLVFTLTWDKETVLYSQPQFSVGTLRAMCFVALSKFMVPYR